MLSFELVDVVFGGGRAHCENTQNQIHLIRTEHIWMHRALQLLATIQVLAIQTRSIFYLFVIFSICLSISSVAFLIKYQIISSSLDCQHDVHFVVCLYLLSLCALDQSSNKPNRLSRHSHEIFFLQFHCHQCGVMIANRVK